MAAPPSQSANVLDINYANNADLAQVFAHKEAGQDCTLTIKTQVISKDANGVRLGINLVIPEDPDYKQEDVSPTAQEPIVMAMREATRQEKMGYNKEGKQEGPIVRNGEPPETVRNSLGRISNV